MTGPSPPSLFTTFVCNVLGRFAWFRNALAYERERGRAEGVDQGIALERRRWLEHYEPTRRVDGSVLVASIARFPVTVRPTTFYTCSVCGLASLEKYTCACSRKPKRVP